MDVIPKFFAQADDKDDCGIVCPELPVVGDDDKLIGSVGVHKHHLLYMQGMAHNGDGDINIANSWLNWPMGRFEDERKRHGDSDISSAVLHKEDVPTLRDLARLFSSTSRHVAYVVDASNKPIEVYTPVDLMRAISVLTPSPI